MKHSILGWIAIAAIAFAGCGTDTDLTDTPRFNDGVNVLQLYVTNGTTGAAVDNATITVFVGQQRLASVQDGNLYSVYGIPGGNTFPMTIEAEGFQAFRGRTPSYTKGNLAGTQQYNFNFEGTALLFPTNTVADDLNVRLFDSEDGSVVPGASVVLVLTSAGSIVGDETADVFSPTSGDLPSTLSEQTGPDGSATFSGSNLVLGGVYSINIFNARNAAGQPLVWNPNTGNALTVTIGASLQTVPVFLSLPTDNPVAVSTNIEEGAETTQLVVSFPYAVEKCGSGDPGATVDTTGATTAIVLGDPAATVTLSSDGRTLTADFNTTAGAKDETGGAYVTFSNIGIRIVGSAACTQLGDVRLRSTTGPQLSSVDAGGAGTGGGNVAIDLPPAP